MGFEQDYKGFQDYYEARRLNVRILIIQALFGAVLVVYLLAFWYLQVVKTDHYRRLSDSNRLRRVTIMPLRGVIKDAENRVLANSRIAFNIRLDREKVPDMRAFFPKLAGILGIPEATLHERLAKYRGRPAFEPVILKEDVDLAEAAYIESRRLELPMLSVEVESRRNYLYGPLAAHALGYVGEVSEDQIKTDPSGEYDLGEIVGKAGVEKQYDAGLKGVKGWKQVVVNSLGREIQEIEEGRKSNPGRALRLSIDLDLQRALEDAYADEAGSAVFLDPHSGAVLAMISRPAFDSNVFSRRFSQDTWDGLVRDPRHPLQNRVSLSKFAPGSVFKIVMSIAALEEGVATPARTDHCTGSWRFGDKTYQCWAIRKGGHGYLRMREAIIQSCNVYFYRLGNEMGIERISRWAHRLGFGEPTGIDLPYEESGTVPDPDWKRRAIPRDPVWHPGETISVSIGQGALEVTPIQMAVFAAAIGNGGTLYRPHLVLSREVREGVEEDERQDYVVRRVDLKPKTLEVIKDAMWGVVNDEGTGGRARIAGRDICAKTGTAQVFKASRDVDADKLPKEKRDHAWFVGFAPRDDPKIAWAVFVQNGGHGGTTAAPIARAVLERFFGKQDVRLGVQQLASVAVSQ
ncbi:MAG TPA: penicillin-binding protein 2 [Candidatus Polarisedimenticolia bacterium]|jgi:penicillin-binding protein 2|nr:penicillin-binding protein 2 [Candidatus Polarisedimenticolia bacterium]